jgi:hypothetical protein
MINCMRSLHLNAIRQVQECGSHADRLDALLVITNAEFIITVRI